MAINRTIFVGNLTRDPETREAGSTTVTTLRVAVNERVKQGDEWGERANFFTVSVFGAQGENCQRFLSKGRAVAIDGRLRWREFEVEGVKREAVEVVANDVQFLGSGRGEPEGGDATVDAPPF